MVHKIDISDKRNQIFAVDKGVIIIAKIGTEKRDSERVLVGINKTSKNKRLNICVLELSRYGRLKIVAKKIDRTLSNFRFIFE